MSAVIRFPLAVRDRGQALRAPQREPRLALLGTGTVGSAFVERCERLRAQGARLPAFAWLSNTRSVREGGARPLEALAELGAAAPVRRGAWTPRVESEGLRPGDVVVDATADDSVAGWHSEWLARGIHVVTANKLGNGGDLARAQAIVEAQHGGGARYGDSATVGAGGGWALWRGPRGGGGAAAGAVARRAGGGRRRDPLRGGRAGGFAGGAVRPPGRCAAVLGPGAGGA